jgi:hypothetical protein
MFSSGLVIVVDVGDFSSKSVQILASTGGTRETSAANMSSPGADGTAKILVQRDEAS